MTLALAHLQSVTVMLRSESKIRPPYELVHILAHLAAHALVKLCNCPVQWIHFRDPSLWFSLYGLWSFSSYEEHTSLTGKGAQHQSKTSFFIIMNQCLK